MHLLQLLSDGFQFVFGGVSSSQTSDENAHLPICV